MATQNRILLLDDDDSMLELYQDLLKQLPSQPEVQVCNTGARAIAMLESEPFTLLITDLRMPKMDGLQVLAIVRRKFPQLRIVVLTGVLDEEYRSRCYAQGVEMFWQKPSNSEDIQMFQNCIESMLDRVGQAPEGFRGVQSKSLVDLIQLECLSRSSSILHVTRGGLDGKVWIQGGEIIDAAAAGMVGEAAFKEIMSWKGGNFEILPADPTRERNIHGSSQGLLLDTAQALDESKMPEAAAVDNPTAQPVSPLSALGKLEGISYILATPADENAAPDSWSLESPANVAAWVRDVQTRLSKLGEKMHAGAFTGAEGFGLQEHWAIRSHEVKGALCVGFRAAMERDQVEQTMNLVFDKWAS